MRSGNLDRMIVLQLWTVGEPDMYGNVQSTFVNRATLRAQVVSASTDEFIRDHGASDETIIVFRTRYLPDVALADRVMYGGHPFDIKQVVEIGRRKGLELRCMRVE
jgi:SPP1 family predicted phage head-tail adaptor